MRNVIETSSRNRNLNSSRNTNSKRVNSVSRRNTYRSDLRKVYRRNQASHHTTGSQVKSVTYTYNENSRSLFRLLITAAFLTAILVFLLSSRANAGENTDSEYYKYFTNIKIESGDTLASIADRYNEPDIRSNADYMEEICSINNIRPDNIEAGDYIVIPYYSPEYK